MTQTRGASRKLAGTMNKTCPRTRKTNSPAVSAATALLIFIASAHTCTADPIHEAVEAKDAALIRRLLEENPDRARAVTPGGATPLHFAAGLDDTDIISLLVKHGAAINARTNRGDTPLHWAACMNAVKAARMLVDKGADINARTTDGMTPLQLAVKENAAEVARMLETTGHEHRNADTTPVTLEQGEKARRAGRLNEAYGIFSQLQKDHPQNENVNFALGLTCDEMKNHAQAQSAFERVLQINPENYLARYGRAKSLFELGQTETAKEEFRKVLTADPPSYIRRQIQGYLTETPKLGRKWNLSGRIDAGALDDDNVNVGPDSATISIAPVVFGYTTFTEWAVHESSMPESSRGYFGSAALSLSYDGGRKNGWQAFGSTIYYQNRLDDTPDYESLYYQTALGVRHVDRKTMCQMPVHFAHVDMGQDSLVDIYGFSPMHVYMYGTDGGWYWLTSGVLEIRDYSQIDDRDGIYASAGETLRRVFGEKGHVFFMGFSVLHDHTDAAVYEYMGTSLDVGTDLKLPLRITAYARLRYRTADYAEKEELAMEKRRDTQNQFVAGIGINITRSLGLDLNHRHIENSSSFPLYQYDRDVSTVSMFLKF